MKANLIITMLAVAMLTACGSGEKNKANETKNAPRTTTENTSGTGNSETNTKNSDNNNRDNTTGTSKGQTVKTLEPEGKIIEGTFQRTQQANYFFFTVQDKSGKNWNMVVRKRDETLKKIMANPKQFTGKNIKVYYKESESFDARTEQKVQMIEYIKAELI